MSGLNHKSQTHIAEDFVHVHDTTATTRAVRMKTSQTTI